MIAGVLSYITPIFTILSCIFIQYTGGNSFAAVLPTHGGKLLQISNQGDFQKKHIVSTTDCIRDKQP